LNLLTMEQMNTCFEEVMVKKRPELRGVSLQDLSDSVLHDRDLLLDFAIYVGTTSLATYEKNGRSRNREATGFLTRRGRSGKHSSSAGRRDPVISNFFDHSVIGEKIAHDGYDVSIVDIAHFDSRYQACELEALVQTELNHLVLGNKLWRAVGMGPTLLESDLEKTKRADEGRPFMVTVFITVFTIAFIDGESKSERTGRLKPTWMILNGSKKVSIKY
jgi:hypothetical protein